MCVCVCVSRTHAHTQHIRPTHPYTLYTVCDLPTYIVARWITYRYHLSSDFGMGISEGCFKSGRKHQSSSVCFQIIAAVLKFPATRWLKDVSSSISPHYFYISDQRYGRIIINVTSKTLLRIGKGALPLGIRTQRP